MPLEVQDSFGTTGRNVYVKDSDTGASYDVRIELTRKREGMPFERRILVTIIPLRDSRGERIIPALPWVRCNPTVNWKRLDPNNPTKLDFEWVPRWHELALDLLDTILEEVRTSGVPYDGPRPNRFERGPVI